MTLKDLANFIRDQFQDWVQATEGSGKAVVASSLSHMWQMAWNNTAGLRVFVVYAGEGIRNSNGEGVGAPLGRVDCKWTVAVSRGRGFAAERGDTLTADVQDARPLFDLLDEAIELARSLMTDPATTEQPTDYIGCRPMVFPNGQIADGYLIDFSVGNQRTLYEVPTEAGWVQHA